MSPIPFSPPAEAVLVGEEEGGDDDPHPREPAVSCLEAKQLSVAAAAVEGFQI